MKKQSKIIFASLVAFAILGAVGCDKPMTELKPAPSKPGAAAERFKKIKQMRDATPAPSTAPGSAP